jgi:ABC-2 type transport system ATP-binding protein
MVNRNLQSESTDSQYAIETFSLTKIFTDWWGRNKVVAVDNLDLKVRYNEVFGLLGPNGSGKTTTIKLLLSLLHPTKGKALVLGGDSREPKITARIGFLPEESYLYRYLSARETLDFYGRLFGLNAKLRKMRIEALLEMVGLQAMAHRPVGTFSKGMARRIGLAQALINDPELLILDEPTMGLDPIGTRQIKDLIKQLAGRGKTVLLCSHLLADVEDVCDRIAILYGGRLQSQGRVAALLERADKKQIMTGALSADAIDKIRQVVQAEAGQCEITSPMEKLETFFVRIVTEAERQAQPTSGAVISKGMGFFAAKPAESILDKLVSPEGDVRGKPDRAKPSKEAQGPDLEEVREIKPVQDEKILRSLMDAVEPASRPVRKKETKPPAVPEVETEQAGKSILEELSGSMENGSEDSLRRDFACPPGRDAEGPDDEPQTGEKQDA